MRQRRTLISAFTLAATFLLVGCSQEMSVADKEAKEKEEALKVLTKISDEDMKAVHIETGKPRLTRISKDKN